MNYIVFDLEWNQSASGKRHTNKKMPFEIIEIGAVKLNSDMRETDKFNELVKPRVYKNLNRITGSIVHLNMEQLKKARGFEQVMEDFLKFCGEDFIFCTWGNLDLIELQRNIKFYHLPPLSEEPIRFLDVQKLFALQFEGKKSQHTLEYAVDMCHIEKDIPFHRAFSDAYYTAKVLMYLKPEYRERYSFDTFHLPKSKKEEIRILFDDYYKYISRGFDSKTKALNDREVMYSGCYLCKRRVSKPVKWFTSNSKHYYCVSHCKKHGYIKGKIRLRKTEDGKIYIVKTMKQIPEEQMREIKEKSERVQNQAQAGL